MASLETRSLLFIVAASVAVPTLAWGPPAAADHGPSEKTFETVPSVEGHSVPVTIYRPRAADADHRVPVLLHSHGWSGSRATADDAFHDYVAAGFGVVSIDMRGHGDARPTSEARVHHVDYEVRDVSAVIDRVAALPWVLLDSPGDPRLGALGGSYGGGFQLLSAALDGRVDALAPEITWNGLLDSLAPGGAVKSAWVDVLYTAGNAFARVHPTIHEGFAFAMATNEIPDGSLAGQPDLAAQFTASSPSSYAAAIRVPTLLIQGMPDTLFNFNQAAANYAQIKATGAPVKLLTHLGGHVLNTRGTLGGGALPADVGLQPPPGGSPCGDLTPTIVAWYQRHLLGLPVDTGPEACLALDDSTAVSGASYPLPGTTTRRIVVPAAFDLGQGPLDTRAEVPLFTADTPTVVAGIPHVRGLTFSVTIGDTITHWSLEAVDGDTGEVRTVDSQVTPFELEAPYFATRFDLALGGVGVRLEAGDALRLVAASTDPQFLHNGQRTVGSVVYDEVTVDLPIVA